MAFTMNRTRLNLTAVALAVCVPALVNAQEPPVPAPAPAPAALFSASQVERGEKVHNNVCSNCHATGEFVNPRFAEAWNERPVFELFEQLRTTMPQDNPGSLSRQDYIDVVGYLLKLLGSEIGQQELPPEDSILKAARIKISQTEASASDRARRLAAREASRRVLQRR